MRISGFGILEAASCFFVTKVMCQKGSWSMSQKVSQECLHLVAIIYRIICKNSKNDEQVKVKDKREIMVIGSRVSSLNCIIHCPEVGSVFVIAPS